jgi:hypothetical protein
VRTPRVVKLSIYPTDSPISKLQPSSFMLHNASIANIHFD